MKHIAKMMVLAISLILVISACGDKNNNATNTEQASGSPTASPTESESAASLEPVELDWYYPGPDVPADLSTVQDAVNKITQAKINATIKLHPIGFGDYDQKMNTVVASGEKTDIIWTSSWLFDYAKNQSKGAFIALDELLDQHAPSLKSSLPAFVFDSAKIDGKLYAVPNYQSVTFREGFTIQKRFVDKYKLDINSIKKIEDIEPFLAQIKAGEPDIIPFGLAYKGTFGNMQKTLGFEQVSDQVLISLAEPDKIINRFDNPFYTTYTNLMRSWYTKGYINEDAATVKNFNDLNKTGKVAVFFHSSLNAGADAQFKAAFGGQDQVLVPLTAPYVQTGGPIATMNAISRTSKNPERAMMFINLLNTDAELYNTITYGVEGKHYTKENGIVKVNKDAGYAPNTDWVFGNIFNGYLPEGKDASVVEQQKKDNETAESSPIMGFLFQPGDVSAEIANITSVIDQYAPGLDTGTVDPAKKLAEFQSKLKSAGIDKVIAEAQKQLDAWKSSK